MVIVKNMSFLGGNGKKPRIIFTCEISGVYKGPTNIKEKPKKKRIKQTDIKKCNCPFTLKGHKMPSNDHWMVKVICGMHNHIVARHLKGYHMHKAFNTRKKTVG